MATSATPPASFLHIHFSTQTRPQSTPHHVSLPPLSYRTHSFSSLRKRPIPQFLSRSVDVSKEEPISQNPNPTIPISDSPPEELPKFDQRRLEEKFAVLNTGIYECRSCGYRYDEAAGDPSYPVPAGMEFQKLPEDWRCPTCGAAKTFFDSKSVEISGFAQNQQFGLGGNALTSGQKALLIYGSLFLLFVLFLSGYFLP